MRRVDATEASRSFSALLDDVERGETVAITREGRRVAVIEPINAVNAAEVIALLVGSRCDDGFAADASLSRDAMTLETPRWPDD